MSEDKSRAGARFQDRPKRDIKGEVVGTCIRSVSFYQQDRVEFCFHNWHRIMAVGVPRFTWGNAPEQQRAEEAGGVFEQIRRRIGDKVVNAGSDHDDSIWLRFDDGATLHVPVGRDYLFPEPSKMKRAPGEPFDWGPWKTFFSLTGGSILYCLSALCVVYGISQILAPALAESFNLRETLPCIAAMNVYELALLAVLLVIVLWQSVTDDAISLVVIAALFLVGSGMVLSAVANDGPHVVIGIGCACFIVGVAKLFALRQYIGVPMSPPVFAGFALVLAWNFGAAALLALLVAQTKIERADWITSWIPVLAGGALILGDSGNRACKPRKPQATATPFLRRLPMCVVFAAIVLAAAGVHEYVLAYVFDVPSGLGDYLPLLNIILLLLLVLSLSLRKCADAHETCLALTPLAVCLFAALKGIVVADASFGLELIWYPPVLLALTGAAVCWLARKGLLPGRRFTAGAYLLGVILTAGYSPEQPLDLNWGVAGGLVGVGLFVFGLIKPNVAICFLAIVAASLGAYFSAGAANQVAALLEVKREVLCFGLFGAGTLGVALIFGKETPIGLSLLGALGVITFSLCFVYGQPDWQYAVVFPALPLLGIALWFRTRQWLPALFLCTPLAYMLFMIFKLFAAWRYVILGFILLFGGAYASIFKAKRRRLAEPQQHVEDAEPSKG